jgi:hypothetical protein
VKTIDPEDEATIQRFTTFAHAFSDIKSLEFPDETIENQLITGFLGSLPDTKKEKEKAPFIGWAIAIKDKPEGVARAFGLKIYESYSDAERVLKNAFVDISEGRLFRSNLAPYIKKEDYEIVPIYR